ncbi:glycosyltransferase [Roseococcus sp. YIM B11640]|uniref:glycosyltransferase n=1 Tax=Roseococcus sp. YIM B11640 TaxID=3133973 RepID=UPI003C7D40E3
MSRDTSAEHLYSYLFAREFVAGRHVLELASGEGQAAHLLGATAAQVTTHDPQAAPGALPLGDAVADVVLAFGLLGQGDADDELLREAKRVLRPDGLFLGSEHPFRSSCSAAAIRTNFAQVAIAREVAAPASAIIFEGMAAPLRGLEAGGDLPRPGTIAIASDAPLPHLFHAICGPDAMAAAELNDLRARLINQTRRASSLATRLEAERQRSNSIESSTLWRVFGPMRQALARFPRLRQALRNSLRAAYRAKGSLMRFRFRRRRRGDFQPLVSVIIPNFNHARFLPQRIESILKQNYTKFELLILDDASTDDSAEVIERYRAAHPDVIRVIRNEQNAGNVFRQWRKGVAEAKGELIWICESDDFAEPDFLAALVPVFLDESVMIGFGRIQFADAAGKPYPGLDAYRERSQPGIWKARNVRPAKAWFDTGFGVHNVIANVGGCLIRNQPIEDEVWEEATTYRVLGDWYLYAKLARGGQIAYEPGAVAYFRQHGSNTSVSSFTTARYYEEHQRILRELRALWGIPEATVERFADEVAAQFRHAQAAEKLGSLEEVFDAGKALATRRQGQHILMVILGFYLGGGEIFPIHLANALVKMGFTVSVMTLLQHDWNEGIRAQLDRRIAVYDAAIVRKTGTWKFLNDAGVDLIHTHFIGAEGLFFNEGLEPPDLPYVVTLHGSYEITAIRPEFAARVGRGVSLWVYLTEKNLDHLAMLDPELRASARTRRLPNAMPDDERPFLKSRADLGIGERDVVFALVSRAIPEKGWAEAIAALALAQQKTERRLHLLLCGAGPEADRLGALHAQTPGVHFLGFQDRVHGVYRLADCAILPTRFQGESYPLTLVQAMQTGRPIIATDIGEIAEMLLQGDRAAGLLVPYDRDDDRFIAQVAEAMLAMTDDAVRQVYGSNAREMGAAYAMDNVAAAYVQSYEEIIAQHAGA